MKLEPISDEQLIESLRQDILEQADQIGGLTSELEQLRDVYTATAELLQIREEQVQQLLKDVSDSQQQHSASQTEAAALRLVLEREIFANLTPEDTWIQIGKRGLQALRTALATPSAAAERMRLLEEVAKAARSVFNFASDRLEIDVYASHTVNSLATALAALDAATGEEVKGDV